MAEATLRVFAAIRTMERLSTIACRRAGMVVLDALHYIQGTSLGPRRRWNCKAGSVAPAPLKSTAARA